MNISQLTEVLGGLIVISGAVLITFFIAKYTYLTKKMLAEKGMLNKNPEARLDKMDIAYMVIGVGVGLLLAAYLSTLNLKEDTMDLLSLSAVLIFGAIGLIIANRIKH